MRSVVDQSLSSNLKSVNTPSKVSFQPLPKNSNFSKSAKPVLPKGHRFFQDCPRETYARWIEWGMWSGHPKPDVWFVTLTFKT
ncbi:MAG: hypothetical protein MUP69_05105, partial [Candidatus Atribacteria bacterium]|nr:hypothetical protein [Candidatus Atribacteria bacterium]